MERSANVRSSLPTLPHTYSHNFEGGVTLTCYLSLQQIMDAVRDYNLGLDLRTAAYVCALAKIYTVYKEAGITFS